MELVKPEDFPTITVGGLNNRGYNILSGVVVQDFTSTNNDDMGGLPDQTASLLDNILYKVRIANDIEDNGEPSLYAENSDEEYENNPNDKDDKDNSDESKEPLKMPVISIVCRSYKTMLKYKARIAGCITEKVYIGDEALAKFQYYKDHPEALIYNDDILPPNDCVFYIYNMDEKYLPITSDHVIVDCFAEPTNFLARVVISNWKTIAPSYTIIVDECSLNSYNSSVYNKNTLYETRLKTKKISESTNPKLEEIEKLQRLYIKYNNPYPVRYL